MTFETIEDQIAEHYIAPVPLKRICGWEPRPGYPACRTPLAQANKESLCYRHTQLERTLKTLKNFTAAVEDNGDLPRAMRLPPELSSPPKELRLCAVMGCHHKLSDNNKSGRCSPHQYIQVGMEMKDGSIPRPAAIPPLQPIQPLRPIEAIAPLEPLAALEPIPEKEEVTPVTEVEKKEVRLCAVKDCDRKLMWNNSTGRCASHNYVKQGMEMKDGTIPNPERVLSGIPRGVAEGKECAVMNCHTMLGANNKTGRCSAHYYLQYGMQMKDGSIPKPHTPLSRKIRDTEQRNAAAGAPKSAGGEVAAGVACERDDREVFYPASEVIGAVTSASVSLKVPIDYLDRYLLNMSVADKTRIVEREIFGGM